MKKVPIQVHSIWLVLAIALYFVLILNITLIRDYWLIFSKTEPNLIYAMTVPLFFLATFNLLFIPFSFRFLLKPFFILLILLSAIVNYASFSYGIIFDSDMMANIFQTNLTESKSYLNPSFLIWFTLTGIIPSILLAQIQVVYSGFLRGLVYKILSMLISLIAIGLIALFFYKDYAADGRNNPTLLYKINPTYYLSSTYKYVKNTYFYTPPKYQELGTDAIQTKPENKHILVFILGETARSQNYELNGYPRPTNPYTRSIENLISFKDVYSCGTATAVSLPCMFSFLNREDYSREKFDHQDNIVDVLKRAGIRQIWLENDTGCKGICSNIPTQTMSEVHPQYCEAEVCTDDVFLEGIQAQINEFKATGGIIYLHLVGSHGPTYYQRVPRAFKVFAPECATSEIQSCTDEEIVNTYDNTILFTDYLVSEVIEVLNSPTNANLNSSVIYVSDHGESLGENGVYLHGMPYLVAGDEQKKVPMMFWFSERKIQSDAINLDCLKQKARDETFSHDNLTHSMLGLMNIQTELRNPALDILASCKN